MQSSGFSAVPGGAQVLLCNGRGFRRSGEPAETAGSALAVEAKKGRRHAGGPQSFLAQQGYSHIVYVGPCGPGDQKASHRF